MNKKILLILIISMLSLNLTNASCGGDSECYKSFLNKDYINDIYYINYYIDYIDGVYINKTIRINDVPESKEQFKYLEYLYNIGNLHPYSTYYKAVRINQTLIKK